MESGVFINKAFTHALNEYLENKKSPMDIKFNSFYAVVIRLLIIIYDELDITTPYSLGKEKMLATNLKKYNVPKDVINNFFIYIEDFYETSSMSSFIRVQKTLVDMFIAKKNSIKVSDTEIKNFRDLLYSPYSGNPLIVSYNFMVTDNSSEVVDYFDILVSNPVKKTISKKKEMLNLEAYEILRYSLEDIRTMNGEELDCVNKQVYNFFDVNENAINKNYLLDKAINEYNETKYSFSTGNGYIDILYIMALISTVVMLVVIVTFIII